MVVWGDPYLVTLGVLLVVSILLRVAGVARRVSVGADPALCACLRGNALAVVVTTLATLHQRERVAAGWAGYTGQVPCRVRVTRCSGRSTRPCTNR
jgi:hypothetical protein